jgi:putative ABC transport system permease protein
VAVLFASLSAGATMEAAVNRAAADEMGRAAIRVQTLEERGLGRDTARVVSETAGVGVAAPALERKTYLAVSLSQTPTAKLPPPVTVLGIDAWAEPYLHDMPLSGGRLLAVDDTAAAIVSQALASQEELALGGTIILNGGVEAGPTSFTVVGILSGDGSLPEADGRLVIVPLASAQKLFGVTGVTRIDLTARPGTSTDELIGQLEARIDTEPYLLSRTSDTADQLRSETTDFRSTLLLVAAVVLFVGAFLIFNTLSMTVVERSREVGLLRAAGAARSQVMGLVVLQALGLGVLGSVIGVAAGVGLGWLTLSWVNSAGPIELSAPVFSAGSVAAALAIGISVTLAASLEPAWRAGRIAPVEALRRGPSGAIAGAARLRWLLVVFAVLALAALAVWPAGAGDTAASLGSGGSLVRTGTLGPLVVYGLMLLAVLVLPWVLRPLLRLSGLPFRVFGNEERLARSSLARDTSRTALTAGALVVGLAMVVALGTAAQDVRRIGARWLAETIPGSEILTSIHPVALDDPALDEIAATPGVKSVSPIGVFGVPLDGLRQEAAAITGADFAADGRLVFVEGDPAGALAALDNGGSVIVPQSLAGQLDLHPGDDLTFSTGVNPMSLRVVGIVSHSIPGPSQETLLVGWSDALGWFGATGADFFAVRYEPGQESSARSTVETLAAQYALEAGELDRVRGTVGDALDRVFKLLDALALIAVVVAGLGMVNTLSMSVMERVREIGVLRATGMSSRQVWGMVVVEAGVLGVVGAFLGALVGVVVGGLLLSWSSGRFVLAFEPSWPSVLLAVVFGVLLSITAAIYPAGVASRQSIVRALQHE